MWVVPRNRLSLALKIRNLRDWNAGAAAVHRNRVVNLTAVEKLQHFLGYLRQLLQMRFAEKPERLKRKRLIHQIFHAGQENDKRLRRHG